MLSLAVNLVPFDLVSGGFSWTEIGSSGAQNHAYGSMDLLLFVEVAFSSYGGYWIARLQRKMRSLTIIFIITIKCGLFGLGFRRCIFASVNLSMPVVLTRTYGLNLHKHTHTNSFVGSPIVQ